MSIDSVFPNRRLEIDNSVVRRLVSTFTLAFVSVIPLFVLFRIFLHIYNIGGDWIIFYPALQANDPYSISGYYNPPWLLWLLYPLSFLDQLSAHALWITLVLLLTIRCVYELGGNWVSLLLAIVSPGFIMSMLNGQIDILVLLGLLTGSWALTLIKPQVLGMSILYRTIVTRKIDWVSIGLITVSLMVSGLWITRMAKLPNNAGWNLSLFPIGVPIGIILFIASVIKKDIYLAALSTYFFAPYMSRSSMLVYSIILTSRYNKWIGFVFTVGLWAVWIIFPGY